MGNYNSLTIRFFQLKGTLALSLPPSVIVNYSFLSKLPLTFVKLLKVSCSSIIPNSIIVKQNFFMELETNHKMFLLLYNRFFLLVDFFQLIQLYLIRPNLYFQCTMDRCLYNKHHLKKNIDSVYKSVHNSFTL